MLRRSPSTSSARSLAFPGEPTVVGAAACPVLAQRHHPDWVPPERGAEATALMQRINAAIREVRALGRLATT